jgi:NADPH:quinone reductase-like Zn-dependent oxidoreductase
LYGVDDDMMTVKYPFVPGWEGSGTVVASGGGFMAWRVMGKRVAVSKCEEPDKLMSIGACYQ